MKTVKGWITGVISIAIKEEADDTIYRSDDKEAHKIIQETLVKRLKRGVVDKDDEATFNLHMYTGNKPDWTKHNKYLMDSADQLKIASIFLLINKLCVGELAHLQSILINNGLNDDDDDRMDQFADSLSHMSAALMDECRIHPKHTKAAMDIINSIDKSPTMSQELLIKTLFKDGKMSDKTIDDFIKEDDND